MLREISTCCFNDLRTIFLTHDKRMLGIVLQELDDLVKKQRVMTPAQAAILGSGIAPTLIAGSPEMANLTRLSKLDATHKDLFILKPIRSGKGAGIMFGSDMTTASWISALEALEEPGLRSDGLQQNYLVGTYMSIHDRYLGLATWRSSPNRICAVNHGGAWLCSVIPARATTGSRPFARL